MTKPSLPQRLTKARINHLREAYKLATTRLTFAGPGRQFLLAEVDVLCDLAIVGTENSKGRILRPSEEVKKWRVLNKIPRPRPRSAEDE